MPTSNNAVAISGIQSSLRPAPDFGNWFQDLSYYRDTVNVLTADVARTVASGTLGIATTGVATFSADQTGIIAVGDYINVTVGSVTYKFTVISGATTSWVVSPAPAVAIATSTNYTPVNVGSYVDLPPESIVGCRPVPETWRIRYGGTGTLSGTIQFVRVNPSNGAETAVTTAVATTAAAVTTFAAAVATVQDMMGVFTVTDNPIISGTQNEFIRMVWTAKTTFTTGRTLLLELGFRRKIGPTVLE